MYIQYRKKKGQRPNSGQGSMHQFVLYSEVPLYTVLASTGCACTIRQHFCPLGYQAALLESLLARLSSACSLHLQANLKLLVASERTVLYIAMEYSHHIIFILSLVPRLCPLAYIHNSSSVWTFDGLASSKVIRLNYCTCVNIRNGREPGNEARLFHTSFHAGPKTQPEAFPSPSTFTLILV